MALPPTRTRAPNGHRKFLISLMICLALTTKSTTTPWSDNWSWIWLTYECCAQWLYEHVCFTRDEKKSRSIRFVLIG